MGARRGHAALTLCKQKRISLGTGAVFPSQSEMPKYLLYLDPGVFQETQRSLCEAPYSPLDIAPGLLTRAGSKAHGCQPHVSFLPHQASHRLWGSLRCPWPRASSVGSDQPFPHRERLRKGSRGPGLKGKEQQCLLQLPPSPGSEGCSAGRQRALEVAKPSRKKASPAFNAFTLREQEKGRIFD